MPMPNRPKPGTEEAQKDLSKVVWHIPTPVGSVPNERMWTLINQEAKGANIAFLAMLKVSNSNDKSILVVPDEYQTDLTILFSGICRMMSHPDAKILRPLWLSWDQAAFEHLKLKDFDLYEKIKARRGIAPWNR